jgi:hypothetical protein
MCKESSEQEGGARREDCEDLKVSFSPPFRARPTLLLSRPFAFLSRLCVVPDRRGGRVHYTWAKLAFNPSWGFF